MQQPGASFHSAVNPADYFGGTLFLSGAWAVYSLRNPATKSVAIPLRLGATISSSGPVQSESHFDWPRRPPTG
jgi:hypothetical protein